MAQVRYEAFLDPTKYKRMTSRDNPWGLSKSTFNRMTKELKLNPYTRKKVCMYYFLGSDFWEFSTTTVAFERLFSTGSFDRF